MGILGEMTNDERIQFDRFLAVGYDRNDAAMLGTADMSAQEIADIQRYRSERDKAKTEWQNEQEAGKPMEVQGFSEDQDNDIPIVITLTSTSDLSRGGKSPRKIFLRRKLG